MKKSSSKILKKRGYHDFLKTIFQKRNILLIILVTIIIIILLGVYLRFYRYSSLARFLPQENTLGFVEYQYNPAYLEKIGIDSKLLSSYLESNYNIKFSDLETWFNGQIGGSVHLIDNSPVYTVFIGTNSPNNTIKFFSNLGFENEELEITSYKNFNVYTFPYSQNFYFVFLSNYVVVSDHQEIIYSILDSTVDYDLSLMNNSNYQKLMTNLPRHSDFFSYLNSNKLQDLNSINSPFSYLLPIFKDMAFVINFNETSIDSHLFSLIDRNLLPDSDLFSERTKFKNLFAEYINPEKSFLYLGGSDLMGFFDKNSQILDEYNAPLNLILESLIRDKIVDLFGESIDFKRDILALFENDYTFSFSYDDNHKLHFSTYIEITDPRFVETKLKELVSVFSKNASFMNPTVKKRTLPDGTIAEELVANEESINQVSSTYDDFKINGINISGYDYGFYYLIINNILVVSTDLEVIMNTIDISTGKISSLKDDTRFTNSVNNIKILGDELYYLDISKLISGINLDNPILILLLNRFDSFITTVNVFPDGLKIQSSLSLK